MKLGRYAWNPQTNELQWDDTLRAMWGLPAGAPLDYDVWRSCIHPDDLARVEAAIQRCTDPRGDGVYDIEYRFIGKMDGVERWKIQYTKIISMYAESMPMSGAKMMNERVSPHCPPPETCNASKLCGIPRSNPTRAIAAPA